MCCFKNLLKFLKQHIYTKLFIKGVNDGLTTNQLSVNWKTEKTEIISAADTS